MNFQTKIQNIFDYCYTSSNIRIPEKTCYELGKILHTAMYIEEHQNKIPALHEKVLAQAASEKLGQYVWKCGVGPQMGYSFSVV